MGFQKWDLSKIMALEFRMIMSIFVLSYMYVGQTKVSKNIKDPEKWAKN